jgi:ubiquinol-cytochrome c reductase core subunit 2
MIARSAVSRQVQRTLRQSCQQPTRGYAAASSSFQYQSADSNGIKIASRDIAGPVSTVAIVSRAGTRYETWPGLAEALDRYAFRVRRRSTGWRREQKADAAEQ